MAMDNWSSNDYKTFITSRRDDVFEKREESAFSFKRPASFEVARGDYCEKEVYYDMDVKLPLHWESMVRVALRKSDSEFEFKMEKSAPVSPVNRGLSAADELFHGCQLLPLDPCFGSQLVDRKPHSAPKKQQEDDGSGKKNHTFVVSQRTVSAPFSQMSPGSLTRMFQPKYSKFCVDSTDVAPVETAMDSRSSSFRSQSSSSMCESGDRDAGECSTSRDSNGSSQDASSMSNETFDSSDHNKTPAMPKAKTSKGHYAIPCPTDRRSVVSMNLEYEKSATSSSWLRSPLKWKGIFGGKKLPKSPRGNVVRRHDQSHSSSKLSDGSSTTTDSSRSDMRHSLSEYPPRPAGRALNHSFCEPKNSSSNHKAFPALPNHTGAVNGAKFVPTAKSEHSSAKFSHGAKSKCTDSSDVHSVVSIDRERDQGGVLRVRERWLKYIKILKPPYGKSSSSTSAKGSDAVEKLDDSLQSSSSAEPRTSSFPPQVETQDYVPARAKSMPAILKTPPLRPKSGAVFQPSLSGNSRPPPAAGATSAGKKSVSGTLLPNSGGGMAASSPRLMKSTSPKLTSKMSLSPKVKSSPKVQNNTISPRMSSSSTSSMSELHSAVQGAIAHCKQSHSGLLSPVPAH